MFSILSTRKSQRLFALLSLVAGLGLGALFGYQIIHDITDVECSGQESGNAAACPLCSHSVGLTTAATTPVLLLRPELPPTFVSSENTPLKSIWQPVDHPGRSPPVSS